MPLQSIKPDGVADRVSRRRFLLGLAGSAAVVAGCKRSSDATGSAAPTSQTASPTPSSTAIRVPTRPLGNTGLRVPILEVGGTYRFNPRYVRAALDLGCTFFDTAASYVNGNSEQTLGQSIAKLGVRKDVTIVTKGHPAEAGSLEPAIDASLARLAMDHVDIYYIHNLSRPELLADREWKAQAELLKKSGKIRFFGFSAHNENVVRLLTDAATAGWIDVIMLKYNFRSYGDSELDRALDIAHKAGIGLIAMKTQGSAISFENRVDPFKEAGYSKHQAVLKAVWKDERLAAAISSMPSIAVLQENVAAATRELSATEQQLLEEYAAATASSYCHGGCGGCRRECESASGSSWAIADTLRYLMYHDGYSLRQDARTKFSKLPTHRTAWTAADLAAAERACPRGVSLASLIRRADAVLRA